MSGNAMHTLTYRNTWAGQVADGYLTQVSRHGLPDTGKKMIG